MHPAVVDIAAVAVADVGKNLSVVTDFGIGARVSVGLKVFKAVFLIQTEQGIAG